ncbi:uncharacterized protein BCR38DRAFT_448767 [Pseudomassariella vexata]|uniref:Fe2OG dioxygenase domain-containing protein n=1 Tax=Pseudomassariella vexata TaxID=1141098 RepID=A0A1Y2DF02_9PEZI|nr:uncharacterized protein BCR38DRAFT_448767 [Pseudomassariella vexata]ORY57829.1 hypothetical protein BCR38DRAFT_448767 [Pseudomassariella vexata]
MSSTNAETTQYVHYHDGGIPGRRPILTGDAAKPTFTELPKIDMARLYSSSLEERKALAAEVNKAFRSVGFFYATNHGVDPKVIDDTFSAMHKFFSLPEETKLETHSRKNHKFRGYEPIFSTKLDPSTRGDLKEGFLMGEDVFDAEQGASPVQATQAAEGPRNQWPSLPESKFWRTAIYRYYEHILAFAKRLLQLFALALELDEDYFDSVTTFPMTNIRALHYPPQERDADVGIGAHTDFCWFTLVCQQETTKPALEVLNGNGVWVPAYPDRRTFVVNIGDFLKLLTGGEWQSTVHRVRNMTGEERYSIPFFYSPNEDGLVNVLEKFRKPGVKYEPFTAGEYFERRLQIDRRTMDEKDGQVSAY